MLVDRMLAGAAAGAAATTALNAVTYLDMALRGRPASSTPEETVGRLLDGWGVSVPGPDETRANRLQGLGAVSGMAAGVGVGVVYGLLDAVGLRPRGLRAGAALGGAGAMVAGNAGIVAYGVSDPRSWSTADWLSDLVPHAAYGAVLAGTYSAMRAARRS